MKDEKLTPEQGSELVEIYKKAGWYNKNDMSTMSNYDNMIIDLVKGETPKQKYENLKIILKYAEMICYPSRGTP